MIIHRLHFDKFISLMYAISQIQLPQNCKKNNPDSSFYPISRKKVKQHSKEPKHKDFYFSVFTKKLKEQFQDTLNLKNEKKEKSPCSRASSNFNIQIRSFSSKIHEISNRNKSTTHKKTVTSSFPEPPAAIDIPQIEPKDFTTNAKVINLLKKVNLSLRREDRILSENPFYKIQKQRCRRRGKFSIKKIVNPDSHQQLQKSQDNILSLSKELKIQGQGKAKCKTENNEQKKIQFSKLFQNTGISGRNKAKHSIPKLQIATQPDEMILSKDQQILSPKMRTKSQSIMYHDLKKYYQQKYMSKLNNN